MCKGLIDLLMSTIGKREDDDSRFYFAGMNYQKRSYAPSDSSFPLLICGNEHTYIHTEVVKYTL